MGNRITLECATGRDIRDPVEKIIFAHRSLAEKPLYLFARDSD
uniref:Predicted protein n=1 Tax=Hordeum vulgare subsp. vulgare TaxID=112509 RepID=F2D8D1_HORVV|nr:predicted protein [Hordeum vulgare subsp. vulgare]